MGSVSKPVSTSVATAMSVPASDTVARLRTRVRAALNGLNGDMGDAPWVLAVSGGPDSMVLLDAAGATLPTQRIIVATFDHGTGAAATHATALVAQESARRGVPVVVGHGSGARTEAEWRAERWRFLREVAEARGGTIVTAHTRDDQIETVVMRVLRGAGPRGLAGLYAVSAVRRPWLDVGRSDILAYAAEAGVPYVTDPSNADRRHLRNRIRLDLLPAISAVHPDFGEQMLALARGAAIWRAQMDQIAATFTVIQDAFGAFHLVRSEFAGYAPEALRVLWPAVAARLGIIMDRRGTERLAKFTIEGESGQSIQLSGGVEVRLWRNQIVVAPIVRSIDRRGRSRGR